MHPSKRQYFETEANIAGTPQHGRQLNPDFPPGATVVSVGCGGGWAGEMGNAARFVGVDIDPDAKEFRLERNPKDEMKIGSGEKLPFLDGEFTFYLARVSWMYMDVDKAMAEAYRVLAPGGQLWVTIHDFKHEWRHLQKSMAAFQIKDILYRTYVLMNGVSYHITGKLFRFPLKRERLESFQTKAALKRGLTSVGFVSIEFPPNSNNIFLLTARKP